MGTIKGTKLELGLAQDIQADLKAWFPILTSSKQAVGQLSSKLVSDSQKLKLLFASIDKLEKLAIELGANEMMKQAKQLRNGAQSVSYSLTEANKLLIDAQKFL